MWAEYAGAGIEYAVAKTNQPPRRGVLLRNNQFQGVHHRAFNNRFKRVVEHIKENIYLFSKPIRQEWENTSLREPKEIKLEYIALDRINYSACEELEEKIDYPYLKILLLIRQEHRLLNKQSTEKLLDKLFNLKWKVSKSLWTLKKKHHIKLNYIQKIEPKASKRPLG